MDSGSQRRSLSGIPTGAPFALPPGDTTIHTVDGTAQASGGPFTDFVSLVARNTTGGALTLTLNFLGQGGQAFVIAANSQLEILSEQPIQQPTAGGNRLIVATPSAPGLSVWGHFVRG